MCATSHALGAEALVGGNCNRQVSVVNRPPTPDRGGVWVRCIVPFQCNSYLGRHHGTDNRKSGPIVNLVIVPVREMKLGAKSITLRISVRPAIFATIRLPALEAAILLLLRLKKAKPGVTFDSHVPPA